MSEKFCLKWNDFNSNVSKSFGLLRNEEYLHDVTLVSDDNLQVSAHKLVLSACSEYFKNIFKNNKHPLHHPLVCLSGVSSEDLNNVVDYMYNGEVQIYQEYLDRFLNIAQRSKLWLKMIIDCTNVPFVVRMVKKRNLTCGITLKHIWRDFHFHATFVAKHLGLKIA